MKRKERSQCSAIVKDTSLRCRRTVFRDGLCQPHWALSNGLMTPLTKERMKQYGAEWYAKNKDRQKALQQERARVKSEEQKKRDRNSRDRWNAKNIEYVRECSRNRMARLRSTPEGRLNGNISRLLARSLKVGSKGGRHWIDLVGYTIGQLRKHLEEQFQSGMNWENYGTFWHVDHKIPVAAFNFERPEDLDFRRCWALRNLQPLESWENMSKSDKVSRPFQPCLAITVQVPAGSRC